MKRPGEECDLDRKQVLRLLAQQEYVSGEWISGQLGVTRAAVWKAIDGLRQEGYDIESVKKKGYHWNMPESGLWPELIERGLTTRWAGRTMEFHETLDSTNIRAKELARQGGAHGTLVLADQQTQGRGRLTRTFVSRSGMGVWMTILVRPHFLMAAQAPALVLLSAVAVLQACQQVSGLSVGVKWPNDLVAGGRKICGMLLEMGANMDGVEWAVIGIGINVAEGSISEEIRDTAAALEPLSDRRISRAELVRHFLMRFEALYDQLEEQGMAPILAAYREHSVTLGRQVRALCPEGEYVGLARSVEADGSLIIQEENGTEHKLRVGDVSVRGIMGYV